MGQNCWRNEPVKKRPRRKTLGTRWRNLISCYSCFLHVRSFRESQNRVRHIAVKFLTACLRNLSVTIDDEQSRINDYLPARTSCSPNDTSMRDQSPENASIITYYLTFVERMFSTFWVIYKYETSRFQANYERSLGNQFPCKRACKLRLLPRDGRVEMNQLSIKYDEWIVPGFRPLSWRTP